MQSSSTCNSSTMRFLAHAIVAHTIFRHNATSGTMQSRAQVIQVKCNLRHMLSTGLYNSQAQCNLSAHAISRTMQFLGTLNYGHNTILKKNAISSTNATMQPLSTCNLWTHAIFEHNAISSIMRFSVTMQYRAKCPK